MTANVLNKVDYYTTEAIKKGYVPEEYSEWTLRAFEFAAIGEEAREHFHRLSATSTKYDFNSCNDKFSECVKNHNGQRNEVSFYRHCTDMLQIVPFAKVHRTESTFKAANTSNTKVLPDNFSEELLLSYVPVHKKPIAEFAGTGILKVGGICTIIGHIGGGKSQVIESIVASKLNPYVQSLGFNLVLDDERPLLWIDSERTKNDIAAGYNRIKARIKIENNPELIVGERFKGLHCFPFVAYPNITERTKELERLVRLLKPSLLVLDGAADFVRDVNDSNECTDFIALVISLANEFNFGIITTIHPNPGFQNDYKPRGVLGSELLRKSESVLLLKRASDDRETRVLTMDFAHGKNRNNSDNLESYFKWDSNESMFLPCSYKQTSKPVKTDEQKVLFDSVLSEKNLPYSQLVSAMISRGKTEPTAKRWIATAIEQQMIFTNNGTYGTSPF